MFKKIYLFLIYFCFFNICIVYADENNNILDNTPQNLTLSTDQNNIINNNSNEDIQNEDNTNDITVSDDDKIDSEYYKKYPTLMFTKKNIEDIYNAVNTGHMRINQQFAPGLPIDQSNPLAALNNTQIINENNISIFLNSIMYISPENWAVWINGNKITNLTNGEGEISVKEISPLKVLFVWTFDLTRWELINTNKVIPESQYKIDSNNVSLYFSLSPNQTYIPIKNKIVEGNVKPEVPQEANTMTNYDPSKSVPNEQLEMHDELFF